MRRLRPLLDQPDLFLAGLAAVLAGLAASGVVDAIPFLRAALTIPLVLFVPGYALVSALFPALVVPAVERLLMSVGASIAMVVLVGLVLGVTSIGLGPQTWPVALVALTLALLVLAWLRRAVLGVVGARPRLATLPRRGAVMVAISALIIADVILGARLLAGQAQGEPPLQLWLLPVSGEHEEARLGMRSGPDGGDFRIAITSAGETIHAFDLSLPAQETWETIVLFAPEVRAQPIVARLYEGTNATESRFVTLQPQTDGD